MIDIARAFQISIQFRLPYIIQQFKPTRKHSTGELGYLSDQPLEASRMLLDEQCITGIRESALQTILKKILEQMRAVCLAVFLMVRDLAVRQVRLRRTY